MENKEARIKEIEILKKFGFTESQEWKNCGGFEKLQLLDWHRLWTVYHSNYCHVEKKEHDEFVLSEDIVYPIKTLNRVFRFKTIEEIIQKCKELKLIESEK